MKAKLKAILRTTPDLFVFLRPLAFALKMTPYRPNAQACVACFGTISEIDSKRTDEIISSFNEGQSQITFVQIGSNDGKQGDPIYKYVSTSRKWKGVLVEPIGFLYSRLKENYANREDLIFEKVLISTKRESKTFYYVSKEAKEHFDDLPFWYDQLGNFSMAFIREHLGERIEPFIRSESIEAIPLRELLERCSINAIDFLHIDTEGHDYEIMRQLKLDDIRPKIIMIEFKHLSYLSCYKLIKKLRRHYQLLSNGSDLVAVEREVAKRILGRI